MTEKAPAGVISFYNVPEGAPDPVVDVYVNNVKVSTGGGSGGGDNVISELLTKVETNTYSSKYSLQEIYDFLESGSAVIFYYKVTTNYVPYIVNQVNVSEGHYYLNAIDFSGSASLYANPENLTDPLVLSYDAG